MGRRLSLAVALLSMMACQVSLAAAGGFTTVTPQQTPQYVVNVKSLSTGVSAKADGVTDDTAAVQAALTSATNTPPGSSTRIYFPAGIYRITGTLQVPIVQSALFSPVVAGGLTIEGDGWASSVIKLDATNTAAIAILNSLANGTLGVTIRKLAVIGPLVSAWDTSNTNTYGIVGGGPNSYAGMHWNFEDLAVSGFQRGIDLSNIWDNTFTHCLLTSNRLIGVRINDNHYWTMKNCEIDGIAGQDCGIGLAINPQAGGVQGVIESTVFLNCTNGVLQQDDSVSYIGCQWQNCGAWVVMQGNVQSTFLGCGFSDLFGQDVASVGAASAYGPTNGYNGGLFADGLAARGLIVINPAWELDGHTPSRGFISTYPTNLNARNFFATNYWAPVIVGTPSFDNYLSYWAATNQYNLSQATLNQPTFTAQTIVTNQPGGTTVSGLQHGLWVYDGNEDGGLKLGADLNLGVNSPSGALKGGNIVFPNHFDGQYTTIGLSWMEASDTGGVLGLGGNSFASWGFRNAPIYLEFWTKAPQNPPNAGVLRWRIYETGRLTAMNSSALDMNTGTIFWGTNAFTSGTAIDATKPYELIISASAVTVSGFANLDFNRLNVGSLDLSNSAAAPWTFIPPGGVKLMGVSNALAIPAQKIATFDWRVYGNSKTSAWFTIQSN